MKGERLSPSGFGTGALLTVFSVLCLAVFAVLSISTVQSQRALSLRSADAVQEYYRADARAEEILSRLRSGQIPEQVRREGEVYSYTCPISDTRSLEVKVRIEDGDCTVVRWQAVSAVSWEESDGLQVWTGEGT